VVTDANTNCTLRQLTASVDDLAQPKRQAIVTPLPGTMPPQHRHRSSQTPVTLVLLGVLMMRANTAEVGGAACRSDEQCNLNSVCSANGVCRCVPEWTGPTRGKLNLLPARPRPFSGYDEDGVSSWGGTMIADRGDTGLYHMFVSRMGSHCGLDSWQSNSEIIHATSYDPEGPYVYNSTVLPYFAHGPSVREMPGGNGYFMMHLGCGYPFIPFKLQQWQQKRRWYPKASWKQRWK